MITLYIASSLDGFIARPDGSLDWLEKFGTPNEDYGYKQFLDTTDTVIMGRRTLDVIGHMKPFPYGDKKVFVFSRQSMRHPHVTFVNESVIDFCEKHALRGEGRHAFLVGGGELVKQFHDARCIDRYIWFLAPTFIGDGVPLYRNLAPQDMELLTSKTYPSGMVRLEYERIETLGK